ncbi:MAG: nuclear transport factor 2 family protein [Bacteroidetes bacterium]|nr:nuclear transport factor 2 family protein [Bacteroidota bacterium]
MRNTSLSFFLFSLISFSANAQCKEIEDIKKLNDALLKLEMRKDTSALSNIIADDVIYINPQGAELGKNEIMSIIANPRRIYKSIRIDKIVDARMIGDIGVVVSEISIARVLNGVSSYIKMSVMDSFEKRKGKWLLIASHNSLLFAR